MINTCYFSLMLIDVSVRVCVFFLLFLYSRYIVRYMYVTTHFSCIQDIPTKQLQLVSPVKTHVLVHVKITNISSSLILTRNNNMLAQVSVLLLFVSDTTRYNCVCSRSCTCSDYSRLGTSPNEFVANHKQSKAHGRSHFHYYVLIHVRTYDLNISSSA